MAFDPTPWFVGGGAQHSPEVARALAFASTRGAEGVAGVGDLKVSAQSVPNGTVGVAPGGGLLLNRYAGGTGQTYSLRNATTTNVTVTPTGSSSGRTDLVIARVLDPQYEGAAPTDPTNFQYAYPTIIQGVPSGTQTASELSLGYPAVALAKITLPASTGTVTSGMITDLRKVAQPRRDRAMVTVFPSTPQTMPTSSYGNWPVPTGQRPVVSVPVWATRLDVVAHVSGVKFVQSGAADSVAGVITVFAANNSAQNGIIIQDKEDSNGRYSYTWIGTHIIDSSMRGTDQLLSIQAFRTAGSGIWTADYQTSVVIDWEFSEGAQ